MKNLSEIISKKVLNLYSAHIEGTIENAVFDRNHKKIAFLKLFDDDGNTFLLDVNKIFAENDSTIVIKNSEAITPLTSKNFKEKNFVNKMVFSTNGEDFGVVKDVTLLPNFQTDQIVCENKFFSIKDVLTINQCIIVQNPSSPIKLSDLKPSIPKQNSKKLQKVQILPEKEDNQKSISPPTIEKNPQTNSVMLDSSPLPKKLVTNSNFLVGRKLKKTIFGINNEIVAKKEEKITPAIIDSALKHGKLMELTVFSKGKPNKT